jgi:hypothetical protein
VRHLFVSSFVSSLSLFLVLLSSTELLFAELAAGVRGEDGHQRGGPSTGQEDGRTDGGQGPEHRQAHLPERGRQLRRVCLSGDRMCFPKLCGDC